MEIEEIKKDQRSLKKDQAARYCFEMNLLGASKGVGGGGSGGRILKN